MAESAIDYVNLTRICEFTRALHQFHQIGGDEEITASSTRYAGLDSLTQERAFDFAARHGYDLKDYVHGGCVSDWWGFAWMILAEARGLLTPENRTAAWRKHDQKLMAETNVVGVIIGAAALNGPPPSRGKHSPPCTG